VDCTIITSWVSESSWSGEIDVFFSVDLLVNLFHELK
jgi:hypothetical protein